MLASLYDMSLWWEAELIDALSGPLFLSGGGGVILDVF